MGRIYPELIICLLVTAFVIGPLFTELSFSEYFQNIQAVFYYVTSNLKLYITFVLPGMFNHNPYPFAVNGSLWSIPVEVVLYLLVFVIAMLKKIRKPLYLAITSIIIIGFITKQIIAPSATKVIYGTDIFQALDMAVPYFLIGGCAYLYNICKYLNVQLAAILLFIGSGLLFDVQIMNELLCLLVLPYFVLSLMLTPEQNLCLPRWIHTEYAYGLYLWGFVLQQCFVQKLYVEVSQPLDFWIIFIISVICTYFTAALSYHLIYMPIYGQIQKVALKAERH